MENVGQIFLVMWYLLWPFGIFHGRLVYFVGFVVYLYHFGIMYLEKFGNTDRAQRLQVCSK
jgi:hypothetical protein